MVASQILANDVTDERLLAAFGDVGRECFVPVGKRALAYADSLVEVEPQRWMPDPRTFAKLLRLAEILPSDTVLDVGCTTGYSTAVLSRVASRVVGLEENADCVRMASETAAAPNVAFVQGPLAEGYRKMAPYDVIVVNGAIEIAPRELLEQLAEGGRLVAIFQNGSQGHAVVYLKEAGRVGRRIAFDASLPVLAEFREPVGFIF
jgi:protein-L-isoaspartate(D-aspartate) O-methyltransferase